MRTVRRTRSFRRDYRREKRGRHREVLDDELDRVARFLAADEVLPPEYRDHALTGNWTGYRECHLRFDLLLIYRKPDADTLVLAHLGSHSELGLG